MTRNAFRLLDGHQCPSHPGGGPITSPGGPSVLINGQPAAHLADFAGCAGGPSDIVAEGAALVLIEQLPAAGLLHGTIHGGQLLGAASPDVLIGGPSFSVPSCISIEGTPEFQNKALRDLYALSRSATGKEIFDRLIRSGKHVTIREGSEAECAAPAWEWPEDKQGTVIEYDPDDCSKHIAPDGTPINCPPQITLAHELIHAVHFAEGTRIPPGTKDPTPPITEKDIEEEEAATIGTGSHADDFPTENSLRTEWGLPPRYDHKGYQSLEDEAEGPTNIRPGKY